MRVGIVGCGFIAGKHVDSLSRLPGIPLVAVADTLPQRAARIVRRYGRTAAGTPATYTDHRQLLRNPDVDAVAICVPGGLHAPMAMEALAHGKHVIVEKPMALSILDARAMCRQAAAVGRCLAVCHQKRFLPHLRRVHDLIRRGALGAIVAADATVVCRRDDGYYRAAAWRGTWAMDGGMLLNQGLHDVDLLVWMAGPPAEVAGCISRRRSAIQTEDTAAAVFRYAGGGVATLAATVRAPAAAMREQLSICGTRGAVVLAGKWLEQILRWDVPGVPAPCTGGDSGNGGDSGDSGDSGNSGDLYGALYADLASASVGGGRPWVDGRDALPTLQAILGVYRSHLTRAPVRLPLPAFSTTEMEGVFDRDV